MNNLKLQFNEVEIDSLYLRTEFLLNRLLKQDIKILLLTYYNNNKLQFRNELKITSYKNNSNFKKDIIVDLYCGSITGKYNLKIGTGRIIEESSDNTIIVKPETILVNNKDTKNIEDMFQELNSVIKDDEYLKENYNDGLKEYNKRYEQYQQHIKKDKYINGLFKYYYDSMIQLFKDNNNYNSIGKVTAMSSYIIAKNFFEDKGKKVSYPNVFIRDFNMEFDMLLLKSSVENNKYVYDLSEVDAIVELKSNGIIGYTKEDKETRWFKSYITFDNNYAKKHEELYTSNLDLHKNYYNAMNQVRQQKYIYFCFYERNTKNTSTYENTYFDIMLAGKNYTGIYFTVAGDKGTYAIPIDYDIDKIDI